MECGTIIGWNTLARQAIFVAPNGCGTVSTAGDDAGEPIACDDGIEHTVLDIAARLFENVNGAVGIDMTSNRLAILCDAAIPRVTCDNQASLEELFREAVLLRPNSAVVRVFLVDDIDAQPCIDCSDARSATPLLSRIMASFVTYDGETRVLVVLPTSEDYSGVSCDTSAMSPEGMAASTLIPIGDCGMWAWRITIA